MLKFYLIYIGFLISSILAVIVIAFFKIKNTSFPYIKKEYLLSEAEKKFYFVLVKILGNDYLIFPKVRMADLFYMPKMSNSRFYHYFNKIQSKHVDFLICDKENIRPLLAIELDDSSHYKMDRILRDKLVDKIFEGAKLPIYHVAVSPNYSSAVEEIMSAIK